MRSFALGLLLLGSIAHADPQSQPSTCRATPPDAKVQPAFKRGLPLSDLVAWAVALTCKNVIYDEALSARAPKVTILVPKSLTAAEGYALFLRALEAYGVKAVDVGDTIVLMPISEVPRLVPQPEPLPPPPARPEYVKGIKKVDDTSYEITRTLLESLDASDVKMQVRMIPAYQDGKANGIKLYAIRPSSLFDLLGFKNGDKITAIDGLPTITLEDLLAAYDRSKKGSKLVVSLERLPRPVPFTITIK